MLHIGNTHVPLCDGVSRRSFLQAGAASTLGLSLPLLHKLQAAGAIDESKAKINASIALVAQ